MLVRTYLLVMASFVFGASATPALACNIPVFRYALENWQPDPYQILVVHKGPLSDEQQQMVRSLQSSSSDEQRPANVAVFDVDWTKLDGSETTDRRELPPLTLQFVKSELANQDFAQPTIIALYPVSSFGYSIAWQGPLNESNAKNLMDSPLRQEVCQRIADGQSAVWVLIKSGDPKKDNAAQKVLEEQLAIMKNTVSLPDQSLIEAEEEFKADNPIELRVDFSLVTVGRDDLEESAFVSMLLHSESDFAKMHEPIAIPIFGRGRTYYGLAGRGINAEMIEENCRFTCGACSCQIKQENPGVDLLMAFDWSSKIMGSAMQPVELPELTGIGFLDVDENINKALEAEANESRNRSESDSADEDEASQGKVSIPDEKNSPALKATSTTNSPEAKFTDTEYSFESSLLWWAVGAVVGVGLIVGLSTIVLLKKAS